MKVGDTCYIITNNIYVKQVIVLSIIGNMYTVRFLDKKHRNKVGFNRPDLH